MKYLSYILLFLWGAAVIVAPVLTAAGRYNARYLAEHQQEIEEFFFSSSTFEALHWIVPGKEFAFADSYFDVVEITFLHSGVKILAQADRWDRQVFSVASHLFTHEAKDTVSLFNYKFVLPSILTLIKLSYQQCFFVITEIYSFVLQQDFFHPPENYWYVFS